MSHYTRFIILHNDGYTQQFVGNPQSNRDKAEREMARLIREEYYEYNELTIVEVPN